MITEATLGQQVWYCSSDPLVPVSQRRVLGAIRRGRVYTSAFDIPTVGVSCRVVDLFVTESEAQTSRRRRVQILQEDLMQLAEALYQAGPGQPTSLVTCRKRQEYRACFYTGENLEELRLAFPALVFSPEASGVCGRADCGAYFLISAGRWVVASSGVICNLETSTASYMRERSYPMYGAYSPFAFSELFESLSGTSVAVKPVTRRVIVGRALQIRHPSLELVDE